jgi:hypothetical protein
MQVQRDFSIGSAEHKDLFCRVFVETHDPYDPYKMPWPELDPDSLARLRAMPFWHEAISTERDVARKVQALVPHIQDKQLRDAIDLQGFEEGRHAAMLGHLVERYEIPLPEIPSPPLSGRVEWDFIQTGYGECFDSFFAFGLYFLAKKTELFPASLIDVVQPIVQEEARHILFFVNWIAYRRVNHPGWMRPLDFGQTVAAMASQIWFRIQTARGAMAGGDAEDDFMLGVRDSLDLPSTPREFLDLCLREHEARLAPYDDRLLRPRFVPAVAKSLTKVLR